MSNNAVHDTAKTIIATPPATTHDNDRRQVATNAIRGSDEDGTNGVTPPPEPPPKYCDEAPSDDAFVQPEQDAATDGHKLAQHIMRTHLHSLQHPQQVLRECIDPDEQDVQRNTCQACRDLLVDITAAMAADLEAHGRSLQVVPAQTMDMLDEVLRNPHA